MPTDNFSPNVFYDKVAVFTAAADSAVIDIGGCKVVGLITPASLGVTAIKFKAATAADGTYLPLKDETGTEISVTVDTSNAGWYDLSDIFPVSVRHIKLSVASTITKNVTLATMNI